MFSVLDCLNLNVNGWNDCMIISIGLVPIVVLVMIGYDLVSSVPVSHEIDGYSNIEILLLMGPVLFLLGVGVIGSIVSYDMIAVEWVDILLLLSAAQWYWDSFFDDDGIDNSTNVTELNDYTSCDNNWCIAGISIDVLHSFNFNLIIFHTDCIPGKIISHDYFSALLSVINIKCQELCSYGHSGMLVQIDIDE